MKFFSIFTISLLSINHCISDIYAQTLQNYVRNPSFEQYKDVPKDLGALPLSSFHTSPTTATGDYFHKRAKNTDVGLPRNKMGVAPPRTGSAYVGIYAYTNRYTRRDFREYVQLELKQQLNPNELYCIKAHVYLSQSSNRAIGALGVSASRFPFVKDHQTVLETDFVYMLREDKKPLSDRQWVEISATYKAVGGEKYIILGNFNFDKDTKVTGAVEIDSFRNPNVDFAYYFIDDVCVTGLKYNTTCDCGSFDYQLTQSRERIVIDMTLTPKTYKLGEPTILQGVKFERNKAIFLPSSHRALDEVVEIMKRNATYEIEISGHTDDRGDAQEDHFLSKRRAKAVYDYLVASGIAENRLAYRGYGQSRPIALNDSPENRERNERIQLLLTKQ